MTPIEDVRPFARLPGEAVKLGGATYVLPPDKIPATVQSTVNYRLRMQSGKKTPVTES